MVGSSIPQPTFSNLTSSIVPFYFVYPTSVNRNIKHPVVY